MDEYFDYSNEFRTLQEKSISCKPSITLISKPVQNEKTKQTLDDMEK